MLPNFPSCGHLAAGFSWLKLWKHSFSSFHGRAYPLFSCYGPRAVFAHSLPWLSHAVVLLLDSGYLVTWFLASHLCRPLSSPRPPPRPWPCTQLEGTYLLCCDRYFFSTACPEKPPILIIAIDNCTLILPYSILPYPTLPYPVIFFTMVWTLNRGLQPRALHLLSKHSTTELYLQPSFHSWSWDRVSSSCPEWPWIHSSAQVGFIRVISLGSSWDSGPASLGLLLCLLQSLVFVYLSLKWFPKAPPLNSWYTVGGTIWEVWQALGVEFGRRMLITVVWSFAPGASCSYISASCVLWCELLPSPHISATGVLLKCKQPVNHRLNPI